MSQHADERSPRYAIVAGDRFAAEREAYGLRLNRILGPDYVGKWFDHLTQVLRDLATFPGPYAHQVDETASAFFGYEVRRLLHYGPTRRRSGTPIHILYAVHAPIGDDDTPPATAARSAVVPAAGGRLSAARVS